VFETAVGMIA